METITHSAAETEAAGRAFAKALSRGDVVACFGDLGAGKTAFARGVAAGLGCKGRVTSPTFTIVNEYDGPLPLFHFDMYRLGGEDDLFDIGWEDYLSRGGVCLVEWSERIAALISSVMCGITWTVAPRYSPARSLAITLP